MLGGQTSYTCWLISVARFFQIKHPGEIEGLFYTNQEERYYEVGPLYVKEKPHFVRYSFDNKLFKSLRLTDRDQDSIPDIATPLLEMSAAHVLGIDTSSPQESDPIDAIRLFKKTLAPQTIFLKDHARDHIKTLMMRKDVTVYAISGPFESYGDHGFTCIDVTERGVQVENPHDTGKYVVIPWATFWRDYTSITCSGPIVPVSKPGEIDGITYPDGVQYIDGSIYYGERTPAGRKTGKSYEIRPFEGTTYHGDFEDDALHGKVTHYNRKGDKYAGEFRRGDASRHMEVHYKSGQRYIGDIFKEKRHGTGTYYYDTDGSNTHRYEGEWVNDKKHGQGTFVDANGIQYVGNFHKGTKHGKFKLYDQSGDLLYSIRFNKDKPGRAYSHKTKVKGSFKTGTFVPDQK